MRNRRHKSNTPSDTDTRETDRLIQSLKEPDSVTAVATSDGDAITWERMVVDHRGPGAEQKTVYIVDGDVHFSAVVQEQLKHFGYNVLTLPDHRDLEEALNILIPAAVIMEVDFAGQPDAGIETALDLKAKDILNCPFFYVSSRNDFNARRAAAHVQCDGYLLKPVDIIELVGLMDRYTTRGTHKGIRVAVVDDDPDAAAYYETMMMQAGMDTASATDSLQARDFIDHFRPDVIVMDIDMPECNGFELARVIRQEKKNLRIPIIFLSSANIEDVRAEAMSAGGDDLLPKNVDDDVILASVISRGQRARELNAMINHLLESENRFRAVAETAQEGVVTTDDGGRVIYWNQGAEKTFGYQLSDMLGKPVSGILSGIQTDGVKIDILDIMGSETDDFTGKVFDGNGIHKSGRVFPVELSLAGWEIDDHQYFTSIVRDTTQWKNTESALSKAKQEAESANEAKSDFLASMSHELRTPLNAILGFAQLMQIDTEHPLNGLQVESADQIIKGGNYLLELIDEVLDFAKINSGQIYLNIQSIASQTVLEQCMPLVEVRVKERDIKVDTNDFGQYAIMADQVRFKQVLLNLMTNAVKYNKDSGTVTIRSDLSGDDTVRFSVSDTGHGIAEDQMEDLFRPFHRLGAEATETEGTGIGLTITERLVKAMHGEMGVESTPDEGSTFWVDLPLAQNDGKDVAIDSQTGDTPSSVVEDGVATILYVEDNKTNIQLMEMLFAQFENRNLETVMTAEDGLDMARKVMPDLILMDINLPGMNGLEALVELKKDSTLSHIPVIAVTAAATPDDIERGMDAGFYAYVTKPFSVSDMVVATENAIAKGRS